MLKKNLVMVLRDLSDYYTFVSKLNIRVKSEHSNLYATLPGTPLDGRHPLDAPQRPPRLPLHPAARPRPGRGPHPPPGPRHRIGPPISEPRTEYHRPTFRRRRRIKKKTGAKARRAISLCQDRPATTNSRPPCAVGKLAIPLGS